jgi:hypothetical protein
VDRDRDRIRTIHVPGNVLKEERVVGLPDRIERGRRIQGKTRQVE